MWPRNLVIQGFKYCELCWRIWWFARRDSFQVVNVHSLDLLPLGVLLKLTLHMRLVYDAHELETEANGLTGIRQTLARFVEWALLRFADLTIVVSDGIREWYRNRYGALAIVTVLNTPELSRIGRTNLLRARLGIPDDKIIVLYQGSLSPGRGIEFLLRVFAECGAPNLVLVFLGYGVLEAQVREAADRNDKVYLHPAVRPDELLGYTASADIGVSLIENTCLSYYWCLPNKLFEYVLAGLPVVVSDLPEMAKVVRQGRIGAVLASHDPSQLLSAINQITAMDQKELRENVARCARTYAWEEQEQSMIAAYREYGIA
jgi:glycosyltransferase involved in cell wall biosynthesis